MLATITEFLSRKTIKPATINKTSTSKLLNRRRFRQFYFAALKGFLSVSVYNLRAIEDFLSKVRLNNYKPSIIFDLCFKWHRADQNFLFASERILIVI
jgi:hypothetical protein